MNKSDQTLSLLEALPLFSETDHKNLKNFLQSGKPLDLSAGETLPMESAAMLGVLTDGKAEILSADHGKTVILRTLREGDLFGAASLFSKEEMPLSKIEAVSACRLLLFDRDAVRQFLLTDPAFLDAYLGFLANRVSFLNRKIRCFTAGSAERRLALWLISEEHDRILLPSVTILSDMLDIGRASLYRALDKLADDHLIARKGREIEILDRNMILKNYQ